MQQRHVENCGSLHPYFHQEQKKFGSSYHQVIIYVEKSKKLLVLAFRDHKKVNGNHLSSDCNDRNDPINHVEITAQRSQQS